MKLIIAEKPSLGRNIAAAIEQMSGEKLNKCSGYLEGTEYIVTWAFGHLFSLADVDYYAPNPDGTTRWTLETLPCFPEKYVFELRRDKAKGKEAAVDPGVVRQFNCIKSLCARQDVEAIINAGDADREGEIIVRLCIDKAEAKSKPQYRLWLPDQTPRTVIAALKDLKPAEEYDLLANEGYARTLIDWLYGVNLTRYATLKTGAFLRVGRVIVPIVRAIYERDMAIRNFKPETYLSPVSKTEKDGAPLELVSRLKFSTAEREKAERICAQYHAGGAVVTALKRKKDTLFPGKLYSLTKLQNALGKRYKMPMEKSLAILQKLYEAGYVTYPRTNSEYLATAEKGKIRSIIENVASLGYPVVFKDKKTVFDDSKIESHSALTPTYKIPKKGSLSDDETKVYSAILRRFVAVFCKEDCIVDKTEVTLDVAGGDGTVCDGLAGETFTLKGTVIVEPGWTKYDTATAKDKLLPPFTKGEHVEVSFAPAEKETTPPKHYTIETLNNYLKNPFREEKAAAAEAAASEEGTETDDTEDYKAIFEGLELGTEATRTGIIDNARQSRYIALKKDVYTILPDGEFLVKSLDRMGIGMDKYKTSEVGQALKKVYRGKMSVKGAVYLAQEKIRAVFAVPCDDLSRDRDDGVIGDVVGNCPVCGKEVRRSRYGYGCSGYKEGCKFRFGNYICGRVISLSNARRLLAEGSTAKITGFVSKNGKPFDAYLVLTGNEVKFSFNDPPVPSDPAES